MSDLAAIEELAKTVSMLSADAVQRANSGHPGLPMGAAGYASLLWAQFLRFNPQEPRRQIVLTRRVSICLQPVDDTR
jgi:transketolase